MFIDEIEPTSWKQLREKCGFIHDVVVEDAGQRTGILMEDVFV